MARDLVLIIVLARSDRLDAMLGVPTRQIMQDALPRIVAALRPADRFIQLSDDKICVILPNLRSDALPVLAAGKIQQAFESPFRIVARVQHSKHCGINFILQATVLQGDVTQRDGSRTVCRHDGS